MIGIVFSLLMLPYAAVILYYASVLFIRSYKNKPHDKNHGQPNIKIAVIIALRNEEQNIAAAIDSILKQSYRNFVLYLINDNSTDKSSEIISDYAKKNDNIIALKASGKGKKQAIKQAVEQLHEDYIICTDADCSVPSEWLSTIVEYFVYENADLVIAPVSINARNALSFQVLDNMSLQAVTAASALAGNATMANGANIAFRRQAYMESINDLHFDKASGDDMFLLESIKRKKGKICYAYSQKAIVKTQGVSDIRGFFNQHSRWLSKAGAYSDKSIIALGTVVVIAQILLIVSLISSIWEPLFLWTWIIKILPDFFLLLSWARFTRQYSFAVYFVPASIVYPFYVAGVIFYSIIARPLWKNRILEI